MFTFCHTLSLPDALPICFIALVQRLVLRPWNGIIRIAVRARIFIGDAGFRIGLASEMLILRDTGVCHLRVGIVDHGHRLEPFLIHRFMPELKGAVRELRSEEHTSELQSLMRISYA